jgi:hypothetical protein
MRRDHFFYILSDLESNVTGDITGTEEIEERTSPLALLESKLLPLKRDTVASTVGMMKPKITTVVLGNVTLEKSVVTTHRYRHHPSPSLFS